MAKNNALGFGGDSSSKWKKGIGTFTFHPDYKENHKVKFTMDKESWKFLDKLLPDYPVKIDPEQEYFVELVLDDDEYIQEISNIRPAKWMGLAMKVVDCTRNEAGEPSFYSYTATFNGKDVDMEAFHLFYECVDKDSEFYKVRFPNRYIYKFEEDPDKPGYARWIGAYDNPKATQLHKIVDHLSMLGAVDEPIKWPDDRNLLPELMGRMLAAGVVVETAGGGKYASITEMIESKVQPQPETAPDNSPIPDEEKRPNDDDWDDVPF